MTSTSANSSGSNTTVTPEPTNRRRARSSLSKSNSTTSKRRSASHSSIDVKGPTVKPRPRRANDKQVPDVFQYMETWDSRAGSRLTLADVPPAPDPPLPHRSTSTIVEDERDINGLDTPGSSGDTDSMEERAYTPEHLPERKDESVNYEATHSFHSDSGISIREGSIDHSPMATGSGSIVSEVIDEEGPWPMEVGEAIPGGYYRPFNEASSISIEDAESFYRDGTSSSPVFSPSPRYMSHPSVRDSPIPSSRRIKSSRRLRAQTSSEISLDNPIDGRHIAPVSRGLKEDQQDISYRKFTNLNHHILSTLQDELNYLESLLRQSDGSYPPPTGQLDTSMQHLPALTSSPSQSFHEPMQSASSPIPIPSSLHHPSYSYSYSSSTSLNKTFQRHELVSQIQGKLEQYNRALSSFQQMQRSFPGSVSTNHAPTRELGDLGDERGKDDDIITLHHLHLPPRHQSTTTPTTKMITRTIILSLLSLLLPFLLFHFLLPSLLPRFLLIFLATGVGYITTLTSSQSHSGTDHENLNPTSLFHRLISYSAPTSQTEHRTIDSFDTPLPQQREVENDGNEVKYCFYIYITILVLGATILIA